MGILCKAATAECVEVFEVRGICEGDPEKDDVLSELKSIVLCLAHRHSFSWGRQRVISIDGVEKVAITGRDVSGSVEYGMIIPNRARHCGALISMPAEPRLSNAEESTGDYSLLLPALLIPYLIYSHEVNEAFDELLD